MKTKIILTGPLLLLLLFAIVIPARAQTTTPRQTLNQYVADLQKSPDDTALRQKIIAIAKTMRPAPAIPEEARGHYVMAATFMEKAKDNAGLERAIEQYKAALLAAPWWADAYKKLATAQKAADHYDDAVASLNLYLLTQPPDARDAQDEIYKLKALKESAADDQKMAAEKAQAAAAQAAAEEQQRRQAAAQKAIEDQRAQQAAAEERKVREQEDFLRRIDGAQYVHDFGNGYVVTLTVLGDTIRGNKDTAASSTTYKIAGHKLHEYLQNGQLVLDRGMTGSISEDGNTIGLDSSNTTIFYVRVR